VTAHPETPTTFACPLCGTSSPHPEDVRFGYCARCHAFTGELLRSGADDEVQLLIGTTLVRLGSLARDAGTVAAQMLAVLDPLVVQLRELVPVDVDDPGSA
jgi:hypothetical protein